MKQVSKYRESLWWRLKVLRCFTLFPTELQEHLGCCFVPLDCTIFTAQMASGCASQQDVLGLWEQESCKCIIFHKYRHGIDKYSAQKETEYLNTTTVQLFISRSPVISEGVFSKLGQILYAITQCLEKHTGTLDSQEFARLKYHELLSHQ